MKPNTLTRRNLLTQLIGLCGIHAANLLRLPVAVAGQTLPKLQKFKDRLLTRADEHFRNVCSSMVWYVFKPKRFPDALLRAENQQDVVDAIRYAKANKLRVAVRNTGHHITETALKSSGLLIDLSGLNKLEVDQSQHTAWIGPGIRSVELVAELGKYNLTFPAAHTAVVGLGGFLLGGGLGWNLQQCGVSCHSVVAAEIVTADGEMITATEEKNQDWLWALRGSGPAFFGVVTRLQLKLYPLSKRIVKNTYIFTRDQLPFATAQLDSFAKIRDKRVEILTVLKHSEDVPVVAHHGVVFIVNLIAFVDSEAQVDEVLQPFEKSAFADKSLFRKERVVTTYSELYAAQSVTDRTSQYRTTSENIWTDKPSEALQRLSDHFVNTKSKYSFVLAVYGVKGLPDDPASLPYFADNYVVCTLVADEEAHVEANFLWMDTAVKLINPLSKGRYINEVEARRYPGHVRECFTAENWRRLTELRKKHDPLGVFFKFPDFS